MNIPKPMLAGYVYVYRAENQINGKSYIGLSRDFLTRQKRHESAARNDSPCHFHRAIRLYGWESFEWSILECCSSEESASESEQLWIRRFDSYHNGYNMTTGGEGGWSKITRDETKHKLSLINAGKTYEEIHGQQKATEIRKRMSEKRKGMKFSAEHRQKMSEANIKRWKTGNIGKKGKPCAVFDVDFKNCAQAARALGVSPPTARQWARTGQNGVRFL